MGVPPRPRRKYEEFTEESFDPSLRKKPDLSEIESQANWKRLRKIYSENYGLMVKDVSIYSTPRLNLSSNEIERCKCSNSNDCEEGLDCVNGKCIPVKIECKSNGQILITDSVQEKPIDGTLELEPLWREEDLVPPIMANPMYYLKKAK